MSKKELIKNILEENNFDLYLFLMKKLLTDYPEFRIKLINEWGVFRPDYIDIKNIHTDSTRIYSKTINQTTFNYVAGGLDDQYVKKVLKREIENEF